MDEKYDCFLFKVGQTSECEQEQEADEEEEEEKEGDEEGEGEEGEAAARANSDPICCCSVLRPKGLATRAGGM